jgi:hypothetical protein
VYTTAGRENNEKHHPSNLIYAPSHANSIKKILLPLFLEMQDFFPDVVYYSIL